jgi:hydroxypyruvate reductase
MESRKIAHQMIKAALKAVDPFQTVLAHLKRHKNNLTCGSQVYNLDHYDRVRVIGFGKGSAPMAQAVHTLLADKITGGLVIVKYNHTLPSTIDISPIELVEAGHPVPDSNGLEYTKNLSSFLTDSAEGDLILCLISGGGSALLVQPVSEVSLADLQSLTKHLLEAGATINEINTIRKHLSKVKGGWLAQLAKPATLVSLILSDVGGDPLDIIASGPTTPDPSTFTDALAILEKYQLIGQVEPNVLSYLLAGSTGKQPETPKPGDTAFDKVQNVIIANNHMAIAAAADKGRSLDLNSAYLTPFIEGEARRVAHKIAALAQNLSQESGLLRKPIALILGGETTVTIKGEGLGGRNQELALATAIEIQDQPNLLVAYFATDGNDGPTDAAGAFADGQTIAKATAVGMDAQAYLDNNDSYHFFQAIDDLIITGPTNTNVNDIALILAW